MKHRQRVLFGVSAVIVASVAFVSVFIMARRGSPYEARVYTGSDGVRLPYRLYVPPSYDPTRKYPLVIWLHGSDAIGTDNAKQITGYNTAAARVWTENTYRERFPAVVVAPQSFERSWFLDLPNGVEGISSSSMSLPPLAQRQKREEELFFALIAQLEHEFSIDADRIYLLGQSMGGMGTWAYLSHRPDLFAAAVVLCGPAYSKAAPRITGVPVWVFHGAQDDRVSVNDARKMVELLRKSGGQPRYTEYPDLGHEIGPATFRNPELLPWLFAQKRLAHHCCP